MATLQLLAFYYLDFDHPAIHQDIAFLILASICITAAGYLFNDWFDKDADRHNKPNKQYILNWSAWSFWLTYLVLTILGLTLCAIVSKYLLYSYAIVAVVLVTYSLWLKRLPLVGNFAVSLLAAFSVYIVYLTFGSQDEKLVIFYTGFAALLTYIREIIKDMEDVVGDAQAGYKTFPILAGLAQSKTIVLITLVFVTLSYLNLLFQWIIQQFKMPIQGVVLGYHVLCVGIPMLVMLYLTYTSKKKSDYTQLSILAKYIMATGLLSMVFY